jgi:hypothetical protein
MATDRDREGIGTIGNGQGQGWGERQGQGHGRGHGRGHRMGQDISARYQTPGNNF